jgi:hypothetical protein
VSCEECGGPLPLRPYVWTCWSDDAHIWCDYQFCSGVCRDIWTRRRHLGAVCFRCHRKVYPDDLAFRWVDEERRSESFHRTCL